MNYNITLFGNKTTTANLLRHLTNDGHTIDLVVTLSAEAEATKNICGADNIARVAEDLSIPVYVTQDYALKSEADKKFFAENEFGIGVCTGWQRLLPRHVLKTFPTGVFGFHGSLWEFPRGRGRSPLNWSIRMGGNRIYHNCFKYVEAADAGEVFNTTEFPISKFDSISSVQFKALLDMKQVSSRLLNQYKSNNITTSQQAEGAVSEFQKLGPQDGLIKFSDMACADILNLINATSRPFPGAFAATPDESISLKIWQAIPFEFPFESDMDKPKPGTVIDASLGKTLIKCVDGFLLVTDYDFNSDTDIPLACGLQFI